MQYLRARNLSLLPCLLTMGVATACLPPGWTAQGPLYLAPTPFPFKTGPYLVRIGPGSTAVVINHSLPKAPTVRWWRTAAPDQVNEVVAEFDGKLWVAQLDNLPFDEPLSYAVDSTAGQVGPISFWGGRSRGQRFRFAAFGDTRTGHQVHRELIDLLADEHIDFIVHSGDMVASGGIEDEWDLFFRIEGPLLSHAPEIGAVGNHDVSRRRYYEQFYLTKRYAGENRYFYQDWGDVRFVTLDTTIEMRQGSPQYAFIEKTLAAGEREGFLMVLNMHHPPFSSGAHGSEEEVQEVISELAPKYGVEVVLAGHDHMYERTKKIDGVTYIIAASSGAPIRKISPRSFSEVLRTEPHYLLFDVEPGGLVGRAITIEGQTFDTFLIAPNSPRQAEHSVSE